MGRDSKRDHERTELGTADIHGSNNVYTKYDNFRSGIPGRASRKDFERDSKLDYKYGELGAADVEPGEDGSNEYFE